MKYAICGSDSVLKFRFLTLNTSYAANPKFVVSSNSKVRPPLSGPVIVDAYSKTYPSAKSHVPEKSAVSVPPVATKPVVPPGPLRLLFKLSQSVAT